jgi:hypothetical protein
MQHLLKEPILFGHQAEMLSSPQQEMDMPNRLVCNVIEEMRACSKTRNYSYMDGLIEEVQTLVNRMEGKLLDNKELDEIDESIRESKVDLKRLKQKIKFAEEELEVKDAYNKEL